MICLLFSWFISWLMIYMLCLCSYMMFQMHDIQISLSKTLIYKMLLYFAVLTTYLPGLFRTRMFFRCFYDHHSRYHYHYFTLPLSVYWAYCSAVFLSCFLRQVPKIGMWAREWVLWEQPFRLPSSWSCMHVYCLVICFISFMSLHVLCYSGCRCLIPAFMYYFMLLQCHVYVFD